MLTDAGALLVAHGDAAIARLEQAEREARRQVRDAGRRAARDELPERQRNDPDPRVADLPGAGAPNVHLILDEADPEDSLPMLRRGGSDIAIVYDFKILEPIGPDRDLCMTKLLEEDMHLALPPDHHLAGSTSVRLEELSDDAWLCGNSEGSCRRLTIGTCERAGFRPDIWYQGDDYTVMQALIAAGMGVLQLPDLALLLRNPGIAVVEVEPDPPVRRVWATTLEVGSRSTAADAMIEILAEVGATVGDEVCAAA